jgi:epoxyqueuosine reductase
LLLTEKYSSYVFLGEIFTSAVLEHRIYPIRTCEDCGACQAICPAQNGEECLSSLTQKKGSLSERQTQRILAGGSVWGCDLCQEVCPYTARAIENGTIYSPIPFFSEQPIPILTSKALDDMCDEQFSARAYSWRKRETVKRNLMIFEKGEPPC